MIREIDKFIEEIFLQLYCYDKNGSYNDLDFLELFFEYLILEVWVGGGMCCKRFIFQCEEFGCFQYYYKNFVILY